MCVARSEAIGVSSTGDYGDDLHVYYTVLYEVSCDTQDELRRTGSFTEQEHERESRADKDSDDEGDGCLLSSVVICEQGCRADCWGRDGFTLVCWTRSVEALTLRSSQSHQGATKSLTVPFRLSK